MTTLADHQWTRALVDLDASSAWRRDQPGTPIPFVASTSDRARDGLQLRTAGWRTSRYEANGVLLWCHKSDQPPIGRASVSRNAALRGLAYFDQEDEFALSVERKYRAGVMNGFSVGWDFTDGDGKPIDWRRMSADRLRDHAFYELNEISAVPVPSDPRALTERSWSGMASLTRDLAAMFGATTNPEPAVSGVNSTAARALLDAFDLKGKATE